MDEAFYPHGASMSFSPFVDWLGDLGSPTTFKQTITDHETVVPRFEKDIDDALGAICDTVDPWDFACEPDTAVDWHSILNVTTPYPSPVLTDDMSSTADSPSQPHSPLSDHTLVDSHFPPLPHLSESVPTGGVWADQPVTFPFSPFNNFKFTFQCQPTATVSPPNPSPGIPQQYYHYDGYGYRQGRYYWPGQQLPQHDVGAAGAVAPGLTSAAEVKTNAFAFTSMAPTSPHPRLPSPKPQQEPVVDTEPKPIKTTQKKRYRISPESSGGESNDVTVTAPRPKRKRKQDTTKRFLCPFPGCDSKHSRTHNLKVHYDSVHLGKRPHACDAPGCPRAFSRKHDLIRHHQSAHTDLGSPRKANSVKGSKRVSNHGADKKDKLEA